MKWGAIILVIALVIWLVSSCGADAEDAPPPAPVTETVTETEEATPATTTLTTTSVHTTTVTEPEPTTSSEAPASDADAYGASVGSDDDSRSRVNSDTRPAQINPEPVQEQPSAYYSNCTEARNAGGAPVYVGGPGYGSHLDRDGDGIGCE